MHRILTFLALASLTAVASAAGNALPGALDARGTLSSEGLDSAWHETIDPVSGAWRIDVTHPARSYADGADAAGRWHRDMSGGVHPLDSDEAKAVAITEAWLLRFGWLDTNSVAMGPSVVTRERGMDLRRTVAKPEGGREVTLWFDQTTGQLVRASWRTSFLTATREFADYRDTGGVALPYRVDTTTTIDSGTEDSRETVTITAYTSPSMGTLATSLARPPALPGDVTIRGTARVASVPMLLEGGALLVQASINGSKPMPFILDTGGHAILTEAAARALGIQGQGKGVSTGSGPGSMSITYAKVKNLGLGEASIADQTFLIMPFGFGFSDRGAREPIAGILGLEVFERFATTFDYDRGQLSLVPFDLQPTLPGAGEPVPLRFTFDMPVVDGALDGQPGVFGIDTGNSGYLLVFPQWAERRGLLDRYRKGLPIAAGGGVGGAFVSRLSRSRQLDIGPVSVKGYLVQLTPPHAGATANVSEAGNIGQDVLSRFLVNVNYRRGAMYLAPRTAPSPAHVEPGMRAARKEASADRFTVATVMTGSPVWKAGIRAGDAILSVDGVPAATLGNWGLRDRFDRAKQGDRVVLGMANGHRVTVTLDDFVPD
ncbi:aspartyl protease family protein [Luteibacter aegosomatissinici]|uniref:aspartyl protease family protein n=1 Tax=Luteibacter aegosomatissinici TaxID=2911539 RepID=UPI001FF871B8|nr:aspartyl protease family protein [Luteibacter aegosomatissinici]UPG95005.1 aspartyl protease family protein [Luteibacter aegosomatissinici]